jgi:hypothetical protein
VDTQCGEHDSLKEGHDACLQVELYYANSRIFNLFMLREQAQHRSGFSKPGGEWGHLTKTWLFKRRCI